MRLERVAYYLNRLRVFPRLIIVASSVYFGWYAWQVTDWYMKLPSRSAEESAFVGAVVTLLGGILKFIYDKYISTGKND